MDLMKAIALFVGGVCSAGCVGFVVLIVVAWHSRPQEHADRPEAGSKQAKR